MNQKDLILPYREPQVWASSASENQVPFSNASTWTTAQWSHFQIYHDLHKVILRTIYPNETLSPMVFLEVQDLHRTNRSSKNSSLAAKSTAIYQKLAGHLNSLKEETPSGVTVEEGAVDSALVVLERLQQYDILPPLVAPQGDDAVVMLWSIGGVTSAMTITDGEIGYVVRENNRELRNAHSIKISQLDLTAMT